MTRQDFTIIARAIAFTDMDSATRRDLAERMASELAATNARFNRALFLKACGVE